MIEHQTFQTFFIGDIQPYFHYYFLRIACSHLQQNVPIINDLTALNAQACAQVTVTLIYVLDNAISTI